MTTVGIHFSYHLAFNFSPTILCRLCVHECVCVRVFFFPSVCLVSSL